MIVCIQDLGVDRFMPNLVFLGLLVNSAVLQKSLFGMLIAEDRLCGVWIVAVPASDWILTANKSGGGFHGSATKAIRLFTVSSTATCG